ncbi:Arc family DNA-binding protein [uncultured Fibrella sp.]|uniref:Arc family DNA-binding protein n=1 Tax=uncultured Fibrella sp. TaxID=1284596 RepID=UPI0035CCA780
MAEKKGFLLRLNPEILVELERWAQDEFRSVNGQIEYLLNDALKKRRRAQKQADSEATRSGDESNLTA